MLLSVDKQQGVKLEGSFFLDCIYMIFVFSEQEGKIWIESALKARYSYE